MKTLTAPLADRERPPAPPRRPGRPRRYPLPTEPGRAAGGAPAPSGGASLVEPPTLPCPTLGQAVPDPEHTCPHCGSSRATWVYNPLSRRAQRGWVLFRQLVCCPATDLRKPPAPPGAAAGGTLSQRELDRVFVQEGVRGQTFLTFDRAIQPRLAPVVRAIEQYAHAFQPGATRTGVYLAGIAGIGKSHLIHALVNHARALGVPAVSLPLARLLDLTVPERGETAEEREERNDRRRILRQVPVLAIRDFGRHDLTAEIKELSLLLEYREDRRLVTHFTGRETPAKFRDRPEWGRHRDAVAALAYRIERLSDPILTCDPTVSAYTARMARAAAAHPSAPTRTAETGAPSTSLRRPGTVAPGAGAMGRLGPTQRPPSSSGEGDRP